MNVAAELTGQPVKRRGAVEPRPAVNAQPHQKLKHEHTETEHCGHGRHQHDRLDDGDSAGAGPDGNERSSSWPPAIDPGNQADRGVPFTRPVVPAKLECDPL